MLLFSYGSNHSAQLAERFGHAVEAKGAYIENYARAFRGFSTRWGGGVATLIPKSGVSTYGNVVPVTSADLEALDRREGVPQSYTRRQLPVVLQSGRPTKAWVYLANRTDFHEPSRAYLEAIAKTISEHWTGASGATVTWRDITVR